jgi:AcrR family transcriptional regulator
MLKTTLTRKERERQRRKEEILAAASNLFSAKGFHNVSMQEVAKASEFAVGTLYNFFKSKEVLFDDMARVCAERIIGVLSGIIDGSGSEVERLRAFIRYQPELLEEHADFIKLYVSQLGQRSHKLSRTRKENSPGNVLDSKVEQVIKAGIDKGMFRPVDPAIAAKAISSTLETIAFETAGLVDKAGLTDIFRKVEQLFLDGLLIPGGQDNE